MYAGHLHCKNINVFFVAFTAGTGSRLAVEAVVAVVEAAMEDRYERNIKQTNNRLVFVLKEFCLLRDTANNDDHNDRSLRRDAALRDRGIKQKKCFE